jgi:hypothetical protein
MGAYAQQGIPDGYPDFLQHIGLPDVGTCPQSLGLPDPIGLGIPARITGK